MKNKLITTNKFKNNTNSVILKNKSNKISLEDKLQIDIIFPYVDCDDIEWQKIYYENLIKYNKIDETWDDWATGMKRFRSNGMLKYVFRGIENNCPWVNRVHMIVQSESQIPEWINRDEVNIIYHKDFIPEEYLPTFNSSTIEMFLHNIEDLSEHFIYGNDDTIFTSDIFPKDFFQVNTLNINDVRLVFGIKMRKFNPNWTGDILRQSDHILLGNKPKDFVYSIQHTYVPHRKSLDQRVFNKYKKDILENVSPFRNKDEHNQWLFLEYAYKNKQVKNNRLKYFSTEIHSKTIDRIISRDFTRYKSICLNDHAMTTKEELNQVIEKLNELFPEKSKYEL